MDADQQKKLREPFPPEVVGKLPRVTCPKCRDARSKSCDEHPKQRCALPDGSCGGWMTPRHIHLSYVGHAAVTDRLLAVDPQWTWEPLAFAEDGLPQFDRHGGLWIRLTVAGVTRMGYGDADGKQGPDGVKGAVSDALRNGAMRFGVALDLWHKDGELTQDGDEPAAPPQRQNGHQAAQNGNGRRPQDPTPDPPDDGPNPDALAIIQAACKDNGWDKVKVAERYESRFSEPIAGIKSVPRAKAFVKLIEGDTSLAGAPASAASGGGEQ